MGDITYRQLQMIPPLFQRDGFYIECGAYDGQRLSNSLTLERDLGWEGLLAEADPTSISTLR